LQSARHPSLTHSPIAQTITGYRNRDGSVAGTAAEKKKTKKKAATETKRSTKNDNDTNGNDNGNDDADGDDSDDELPGALSYILTDDELESNKYPIKYASLTSICMF
jgi:hypothetical protein